MASSVRIARGVAERILELMEDAYPNQSVTLFCLSELRSALKPKTRKPWRPQTIKKAKAAKKETKVRKTAEIREAAMKRAELMCECGCERWFRGFMGQATMDHFWGRARSESLESCWMLRADCHQQKTDNNPSAWVWLGRFMAHARNHGYLDQAEAVKARLDSLRLMEEAEGVKHV